MDLSFYYWCTDPCYCQIKHTCNKNTIFTLVQQNFLSRTEKPFKKSIVLDTVKQFLHITKESERVLKMLLIILLPRCPRFMKALSNIQNLTSFDSRVVLSGCGRMDFFARKIPYPTKPH